MGDMDEKGQGVRDEWTEGMDGREGSNGREMRRKQKIRR